MSSSPRIFDCHSHWGTAKAHIFRTPEELARQEKIWKTKGRHWAEGEMMDYMRRNNVRTILDLSFHKKLPIEQIREYHDYAFDIARRNRDVVFGHWLQFDSTRWAEARDEFNRARDADAGFMGFAVAGQTLGQPASDPSWFPFYELAITTNTPVMIMTGLTGIGQGAAGGYGIILDHGHPRHIDFVAARYPELRVLAARPAYPWQDDMIAVMLHKGNVSYEIHGWGPKQLSESLKKDIGRRFSGRVMIGADFPVLEYEKIVADWHAVAREFGYADGVLDRILYRNAEAYFAA
jgi:predicted TIM-barrel fold metal-dependent hydrolase